jgi:hypothetical protein
MKKKLDAQGIANELEGASLFFSEAQATGQAEPPAQPTAEAPPLPRMTGEAKPEPQYAKPTQQPWVTPNQGAQVEGNLEKTQEHAFRNLSAKKTENQPPPETKRLKIMRSSQPESMHASTRANYPDRLIEILRKAVKEYGREISYVRLTPLEKSLLADIVYTCRKQGTKTTENEINRIAINYMIKDFEAHGKESLLIKVLVAINS